MQNSQRSIVVLVGNPRTGSRTRLVGETLGAGLAEAVGGPPCRTIDLAELAALLHLSEDRDVASALSAVQSAAVLVVASPTYKATYTGLMKTFLDRLPGGALTGVPTVPVMIAAAPEHAMAADIHLRPLLLELGSAVVLPSLFLLEAHMDRLDLEVEAWLQKVAPALRWIASGVF